MENKNIVKLIEFLPSESSRLEMGSYDIKGNLALKNEAINTLEDIIFKSLLSKIPKELVEYHLEQNKPFISIMLVDTRIRIDSLYIYFLGIETINAIMKIIEDELIRIMQEEY